MPLLSPDGNGRTAGHETMDGARSVFTAEFQALIEMAEPPADVENRFVRLCNTYDDLIGRLSAGALGMVPPPTFCAEAYRSHLSLAGVIVAVGSSASRNSQSNTLR